MNLYQIREAIRAETDEARITELIIERDRLKAGEPPLATQGGDFHSRMLNATHG